MTIKEEIFARLIAEGISPSRATLMLAHHAVIDKMGTEISQRRKAAEDSRA